MLHYVIFSTTLSKHPGNIFILVCCVLCKIVLSWILSALTQALNYLLIAQKTVTDKSVKSVNFIFPSASSKMSTLQTEL